MGSIKINLRESQAITALLSDSSKIAFKRGRTKELAKFFEQAALPTPSTLPTRGYRIELSNKMLSQLKFFETRTEPSRLDSPIAPLPKPKNLEKRGGIQLEKPIDDIEIKKMDNINLLLEIIDETLIYDDPDFKEDVSSQMKKIVEAYRENFHKNPAQETEKVFHELYQFATARIKESTDCINMMQDVADKRRAPLDQLFKTNGKMTFSEFKTLYPNFPIHFEEQFDMLKICVQDVNSMIRFYKMIQQTGTQ